MTYTGTDRIDEFFLAHHGIKGQKWGVRRFQNPDGTLTEAGKKRYDYEATKNVKLSKGQQKVVSRYKKYGLSEEEAKAAAIRKVKIMKKVGIIAGTVTAAAIAGYVAHNISRDFLDKTIKAGKTIQTLSMDQDRTKKGESFYAAFKEKDKRRYEGWFGKEFPMFNTGRNKKAIVQTAKENVKIASRHSGEKMFNELMGKDKEFSSAFSRLHKDMGAQLVGSKTTYDEFNRIALIDDKHSESKLLRDKFYDLARKKGYGGVLDVNDAKYSGYDSDAVVIFAKEKFGNMTVKDLTDEQIMNSAKKQRARLIIDSLKSPLRVAEIAGASIGIASGRYDRKVKRTARKNKKDQQPKGGSEKNAKQNR